MAAVVDVLALLRERGAEEIEHPGGTLLAHLLRVHGRLGELGLSAEVQLAGLAHAAYGTDGFDTVLLDRSERSTLRALVGDEAELLVYRYGSCDRRRTWRGLAETGEVWDRFEGRAVRLSLAELRPLVDLSIVNELDLVEQAPHVAELHGDYFRSLFRSWIPLASAGVGTEARRVLVF